MSEGVPVALVVGGSGDIGLAIASRLGRLGYQLVITGRTSERLDRAVNRLREQGAQVRGVPLDLRDEGEIERLFTGLQVPPLDVTVNAAGIAEAKSILRATAAHYQETLAVNLIGAALVARESLKVMRKAGKGTIINVASTGGREGQKGFAAYCASKAGLSVLSDSLREEAARYGIRVATISPDKVDTRMHGEDPARARMVPPDDVAEAVTFLLRLSPLAVVREIRLDQQGPRDAST
jgi:NAD(P)-dependent dehydrogenase (short-subunit alcohol dehydrogenase family)